MPFRQYLLNNGESVILPEIPATKEVCSDFRAMQFLDWFIKEEGEEEKNTEDNIRKYDLFGRDAKGLYTLNSELNARVYTAPSLLLD